MAKRNLRDLPAEVRARCTRAAIGNRLRARRERLGVTVDSVAEEVGIAPRASEAYEAGDEHAPARMLTEIADLFAVPVSWFFEDIFSVDEAGAEDSPQVYYVATEQERLGHLVDMFAKLDLEGQQRVLATAAGLRQSNRRPREDRCRAGAKPDRPRQP